MFRPFKHLTLQSFSRYLIYTILCFAPLIEGGTTYYPVAAIQILTLLALSVEIYSFYHGHRYLRPNAPIFHAILIFLGYVLVIAFSTPYRLSAIQQVQLYICYAFLFYLSIRHLLTHDPYQKKLLNLLYLMGLFEAVAGLIQYLFFHQRSRGTFFNPDFFGEYLAVIFCIALGPVLDERENRRKRWRVYGGLLLLGTGIFLSQSRGAALAWLIGSSFILWRRYRFKVLYAWMILFLLFTVIPNPLQHKFLHDYREDSYSLSRVGMWKEAAQIILDHPLGIGLEMFPFVSPQYAFPNDTDLKRYGKIAESPHNEYLRLVSELGLIGGLLFLSIASLFYFKWIDKEERSFTDTGISGALLVFLGHAFTDSNFHEPGLAITIIILSTFLLNRRQFHLASRTPHPAKPVSRVAFHFFLIVASFSFGILIIKPAVGWYYYSKGYAHVRNNREDIARMYFRTAIDWESRNARYHNSLGNSYFITFQKSNYYGWVFRALEELNQALVLNPKDGTFFKRKGEVYQALASREREPEKIQELLDDAFTNYREALKLLPYDASLHIALGSAEEASGNFRESEAQYDQAVRIEPNLLIGRERQIELCIRLGRVEEARKKYRELISVYDQVKNRAITDRDKLFIYFNQEKMKIALEGLNSG